MKKLITVFALAALLIIIGVVSLLFSQGIASRTNHLTSSNVSSPLELLNQHLGNMENYTAAIYSDYYPNATVIWRGNTQGLGGTYHGESGFRLLYDAALLRTASLRISESKFLEVKNSSNRETLTAKLDFIGENDFFGKFSGTANLLMTVASSGGTWKILDESWNFLSFNVTASGGATTFPEWQQVGEPVTSKRSTDWLHNFGWDYGGPGAAVLVYLSIALLAAIAVIRSLRNS